MSEDNRAGEFGPIYLPALQRIRDLWLELEPLVDATSYDDVVAPTELQISLSDGLGDADSARLDIQWSELGMYSFHYVEGVIEDFPHQTRIVQFRENSYQSIQNRVSY